MHSRVTKAFVVVYLLTCVTFSMQFDLHASQHQNWSFKKQFPGAAFVHATDINLKCARFNFSSRTFFFLHARLLCLTSPCVCAWRLFCATLSPEQQWIKCRDNQNGASLNLSRRTLRMRPDKRTCILPLHCGREASDGIFLHFMSFIFQCNIQ